MSQPMHNPASSSLNRRTWMKSVGAAGVALASSQNLLAASPANAGWIDSHVHVWTDDIANYPLDPKYQPSDMVPPTFLPSELLSHATPAGVDRIVLVQMSYYGSDNRYMLDVMREAPQTFGGIGIVDSNDRPAEAMKRLAAERVRGFRVQPGDAAPNRWLDDAGSTEMWRCANDENLAICPLIDSIYLASVARKLKEFPQTKVVIDHFARIGIDGTIRDTDLDQLCALADFEQVHVKISAYYALGRKTAPYTDLGPMIGKVLQAFGAERSMWGSDAPYQVLEGHHYADSLALLTDKLDLTDEQKNEVLRGTAERLFF